MKPLNKILIVGMGFMAGGLGLAIKKNNLSKEVFGLSRNKKNLQIAKQIGAIDNFTFNKKIAVENANLVFVCTPVSTIATTILDLMQYVNTKTIFTDIGSTKNQIVQTIEKKIFNLQSSFNPVFIGGHPLCGSEKEGIKYSRVDLYKNANYILTPTKKTNKEALNILINLIKKIGANIILMTPQEHDKLTAFSSHLPHFVAYCLSKTVLQDVKNKSLKFVLANGFKDTTRIAKSSPTIWKDIFFSNKNELLKAVQKFSYNLNLLKNYLEKKDLKKLNKFLTLTQQIRKEI